MTRKRATAWIVAAGALLGTSVISARAAAPRIDNLSHAGVRRGEACELTGSGANPAGHPRLVAPIGFRVEPLDPRRSSATAWAARITVTADAPVGVVPVRVQTDDGLSNP